jgi:4-amino-4-deoxy-L-arabinose transferase-like glycosyltransferase
VDVAALSLHRLSAHPRRARAPLWIAALVVFLGLILRLSLLGQDSRLHPDEALFAAQARYLSETGDLLLRRADLDKPPLTLSVTALSFRLLGVSEFAARLPNALFSGLTIAIIYRLAQSLYRRHPVSLLAALICACSPYLLAFAPTVFTDVQATWWIALAALLATRGHWGRAGLSAALGIAAKTTAAWGIPLVIALGALTTTRPHDTWRDVGKRSLRFAGVLALGVGLLVLWDLARWPYSFLRLDYEHNHPDRLIRSDELWPRLEAWGRWLGYLAGTPGLAAALAALLALWLVRQLRHLQRRDAALDWAIAGYSLAVLGGLWLIAFNTYDRYLVLLTPFLLILSSRALAGTLAALPGQRLRRAAVIGLLVVLGCGILPVLRGDAPVGGDRTAYEGIDALAAYLNADLRGEVVYDHWLGWQLAYYLGEHPAVTLRYQPQPEALADEMAACACQRYLAAPLTPQLAPWLNALARADVSIRQIYRTPGGHFAVYRLAPAIHD